MKKVQLTGKKFSNVELSGLKFTLLSALFITITQNSLFFSTVYSLTEINGVRDIIFLVSVAAVVFVVINIFLTLVSAPYLRKAIVVIILLIGPVAVYFIYTYNILIDTDMLRNVFQTDAAETTELISFKLIIFLIVFGIVPSVFVVGFVKITPEKSVLRAFGWRSANIAASFVIAALFAFVCYKDYASFFRNNKWTLKQVLPSNYIAAVYNIYAEYVESNREFVPIGEDAQGGGYFNNSDKPLLFLIVVGETARDENFSLGGYTRETNKFTSQQENLFYKAMGACNTSTAASLPCMFSDKKRTDYEPYHADYRGNVLDIVSQVGAEVFWVENDGGCKGVCDRVDSARIRTEMDSQLCVDGKCWDQIMNPVLASFVDGLQADAPQKNAVAVLHQIGSHGPTYFRRYPAEFREFLPVCDTNIIKDCDRDALVNTYDNTILYTDYMISSNIDYLKSLSDSYNTVLLYVSDHGESLGEGGLYLHSTPYSLAPSQQLQVPFMLWFSEGYLDDFNVDKECVASTMKERELSHDNLFHTILGVTDITSSEYDPVLDIVGVCRQ